MYGTSIQIAHPESQYINGQWSPACGGGAYALTDPSTEEQLDGFAMGGVSDAEAAIIAARAAFDHGPWPTMDPRERGRLIGALTELLEGRRGELEEAWTVQTGALPSMRSRAVNNGLGHLARAADQAASFEFERRVVSAVGEAVIRREPVGVVTVISSWNGTLLQTASKIGPALAAGCCVIVKPARSTPMEAKIIAECADKVGFPPGVINVVLLASEGGDRLVTDARVDKVAFTGSTQVGRHIARTCGDRIARYSLELGGKSAGIVLDDADIFTVGKIMARTITALSGQLCATLSRVIVSQEKHDALVDAITQEMTVIRVGSAYDAATEMGPMALHKQLQSVERHVSQALEEGCTLAFGGARPKLPEKGYFFQPTLLTNVSEDSAIAQEEIFGPVLVVIKARDEEHAISIANNSAYGLHGSVFTNDKTRALEVARRIRTGSFAQNGMKLDFALPFGGYKQSGVGREGGEEALVGYLETKTILLDF
jgi:acyl-CoA reductase-like NAD-dependent aldehyde dehydrogenase